MLNPIDTDAVIRDSRAAGTFPGEIHEGVAWRIAACCIVVSKTGKMAVAHYGHPTTAAFHDQFCRVAINAQHYRCHVFDLGPADETRLRHAMQAHGSIPGTLLTTTDDSGRQTVTIRLYDAGGQPVTEDTGWATVQHPVRHP